MHFSSSGRSGQLQHVARPRRRDPSFLMMAAIAGTGGLLAITCSIGIPLWARLHGRDVSPAFALFAGWGVAALLGAYACIHTYLISDTPDRPRGGGVRLRLVSTANAVAPPRDEAPARERAA